MYWSPYTKCSAITEVMGLKRYFHINDNTNMPKKGTPDFDHLYKVRPLVNSVVEKCRQAQQEECQSIDEQMIPTKSRSPIRQYLPMKPHKWGLKLWARCGVTGMLYDFNVYLGKEEDSAESREYGKVGALVLKLVEYLPKKKGHKLYMDNLFSSINLFTATKDQGILAVGTIRSNRLHCAERLIKNQKELQKEGRGSLDYHIDANSNITLIRWIDNCMVQAVSSFIGLSLGDDINRWSSKDKAIIKVSIITMGGVDLCEMLMALYRIKLGTKKWYIHLVYYCINVAIVNAWLLYKRYCQQDNVTRKNMMQLVEF